MAGLGHARPGKSIAGSSLAACGVMVCSPYNCREADWLARASPPLLRCATTGSLEWGPGAGPTPTLPPPLAAVATVQMDTALRRLEMRLCSCCQYCGAHFSEEAAFRNLGLCQVMIIQKILNLSIFLKISVPFTFLCMAPNTVLGVGAPDLADGFRGSCVVLLLKYINLL